MYSATIMLLATLVGAAFVGLTITAWLVATYAAYRYGTNVNTSDLSDMLVSNHTDLQATFEKPVHSIKVSTTLEKKYENM